MKDFLCRIPPFNPVDDGNMDSSFSAPHLTRNCFGNSAFVAYDVAESARPRIIIADVLSTYQARASSCWQRVVGLAKPINAVVGHAANLRIRTAQLLDIVGAMFRLQSLRAEVRRIADDHIGL